MQNVAGRHLFNLLLLYQNVLKKTHQVETNVFSLKDSSLSLEGSGIKRTGSETTRGIHVSGEEV